MEKPVNLILSMSSGNLQLSEDKLEAVAKFAVAVRKAAKFAEGIDLCETEIPVDVNLIWNDEGIKISAKAAQEKIPLTAKFADWNCSADISDFIAEIVLKDQITANAGLNISALSLISEDKILNVPQISLNCGFHNNNLHCSAKFADGVFRKGLLDVSGISVSANFADSTAIQSVRQFKVLLRQLSLRRKAAYISGQCLSRSRMMAADLF